MIYPPCAKLKQCRESIPYFQLGLCDCCYYYEAEIVEYNLDNLREFINTTTDQVEDEFILLDTTQEKLVKQLSNKVEYLEGKINNILQSRPQKSKTKGVGW